MSYVVLARKYRPRSFAQMVGQDHVVRALTHALEQGRLHHAYLFTGTRGIGKTTVSRILAKSLNCIGPDGQGGITAQPCGVCPACTEIDADRYVDYIELDAASNRGIEEARELIERAAYKPASGRFKVFMIDEAHQLTKDAFNALLKTLEEPPAYLKFVLATTDPEKMLPTVLSRCLQFNLRPMAPETVQAHLQDVLQRESVPFDAPSLRLLSRAARGSMRDALSLTDQAIAFGGGSLVEDAVRGMLGAVDRGHALRLFDALASRDGPALLAAVETLRERGLSAAATLDELAALLQQVAVEQAVPGALDADDPETQPARERTAAMPPDELQLTYSLAVHGRAELPLAPDEYAGLVMVLLRVLAFPPAGGDTASPPRPAAAPRPTPAAAPARAALQAPAVAAHRQVAPRPTPPAPSRPEPAPAVSEPPAPALVHPTAAAPVARGSEPEDDGPPDLPDDDPGPLPGARLRDAPVEARASPAPPAAAEWVPSPLGDRWDALVRGLLEAGAVTAMTRELALQAGLEAIDEPADGGAPVWRLRVESDALRSPAAQQKLQAALVASLGASILLDVQPGANADTPQRREQRRQAQRQQQAEAAIREDALVRSLLQEFKTARVVPGSIKPI